MNQTPCCVKVAIRCRKCGRIVAYKLGPAAGLIQVKCPKCGTEQQLDLSLRRNRVHCRRIPQKITITIQ